MLSFDVTKPSLGVSRNPGHRVWEAYYHAWSEYRKKRRDRSEGKGHTPNITTTLEGIVSGEGTPFVAMWGVASTVGRRAARAAGTE
jgi:hypothetical protein